MTDTFTVAQWNAAYREATALAGLARNYQRCAALSIQHRPPVAEFAIDAQRRARAKYERLWALRDAGMVTP